MLEAHLLAHVLAAGLTAAQPVVPTAPAAPIVAAPVADGPVADGPVVDGPADPVPAPMPASVPLPVEAPPAPVTISPPAPAPTPASESASASGQRDPLQGFNRVSYRLSQPIDRFVFRPVALTYKAVVPHLLRDGLRNFISNLFEPLVFFNDVVQLRPKRALHTVGRMALNTLLGLGGVFDVAKRKPFHLIHHDNGFGDTLGYYGIGPIAYVYLPVLGPTTLRDIVGGIGDALAEPRLLEHLVHPDSDRSVLRAKLRLGRSGAIVEIVEGLDRRAENDAALETIRRTSVDPYATLRSSFLQDRAGEIAGLKARDGQAPVTPSLEDPLLDPAGGK